MSFAPAIPIERPAPSGVSFACRTRLTGRDGAAFILTPALQREVFGCSVAGWRAAVLIGGGQDAGQAVLTLLPPEAGVDLPLEATALIKGAVIVRFTAPATFGLSEHRAAPCGVVPSSGRTLLLTLPPGVCTRRDPAAPRAFNGASSQLEGQLQ